MIMTMTFKPFFAVIVGFMMFVMTSGDDDSLRKLLGISKRIVGGRTTNPKRFPYFASIHNGFPERGGSCAGSLITHDMILTAAECFQPKQSFLELLVAVNNTRLQNIVNDNTTYIRRVTERFIHPSYSSTTTTLRSRRTDAMILMLERPVMEVTPINIDQNDNNNAFPPVNQIVTALGLGTLGENTTKRPDELHLVDIPIVSLDVCNPIFANLFNDDEEDDETGIIDGKSTICAGAVGLDTCIGDAGGPLVVRGNNDDDGSSTDDVLVGITSSGIGCGRNPGLYTRVSSLHEWIMTIVCARSAFAPSLECIRFDDSLLSSSFVIPPPPLSPMKFRASYQARFQYLLSPSCSGFSPFVDIYCRGGRIALLDTSDDSIDCNILPREQTGPFFHGIRCVNHCLQQASSCEDVYLARNGHLDDNVYGSIYYSCEADHVDNIGSLYFLDSVNQTAECLDAGPGSNSSNQNFLVAQLGVYCFDNNETERGEFSFADFFFECDGSSFNGLFGNRYSCFRGRNCGREACEFDFERIRIDTDTFRLPETCIVRQQSSFTNNDEDQDEASQKQDAIMNATPPEIQTREMGTYTAQFRAEWQLELEEACSGSFATVRAVCLNGKIRHVGQDDNTTFCNVTSENEIECQDSQPNAFINRYNGLIYECESLNEIPTTFFQLDGGATRCDNLTSSKVTRHLAHLGVECGEDDDFYIYDDYYFECESGDFFAFEPSQIYTCVEQVQMDQIGRIYPVDQTRVATDFRWSNNALPSCFQFEPPPPTESPTAMPTPLPTPEPSTNAESSVFCFSGQVIVQTKERGPQQIKDIAIRDEILVDETRYEPVYSFGHYDEDRVATFLQFLPSGLEVSETHLVFIVGKMGPIPASHIRVGDRFVVGGVVESIHRVVRRGVFNPFTPSGTILANGVLASNYVSLQTGGSVFVKIFAVETPFSIHWVEHTFQVGHRIWCYWLGNDDYLQENGLSLWTDIPLRWCGWLSNMTHNNGGMVVLVCFFVACFGILGTILMTLEYALLLLLSLGLWEMMKQWMITLGIALALLFLLLLTNKRKVGNVI